MYLIFQYYDSIADTDIDVCLNDCPSFPFNKELKKEVKSSVTMDGYTFIRPKYTKDRMSWSLKFDYLINEDYEKLLNLEKSVKSVGAFKYFLDWEDNCTGEYSTVVLKNSIKYSLVLRNREDKYWNVSMQFEEV